MRPPIFTLHYIEMTIDDLCVAALLIVRRYAWLASASSTTVEASKDRRPELCKLKTLKQQLSQLAVL